jgi:hypothetical protein
MPLEAPPEVGQHDPLLQSEAAEVADRFELIFCPEVGELLPKEAAIREKLRLYPLAQPQEVVAMFEFDGAVVSAHLVQRIQQEIKSEFH